MRAREIIERALFDLQEILDSVVLAPRSLRRGDQLVEVLVEPFDRLFSAEPDMYIGPGGTGEIKGRMAGLQYWLQHGAPLEASEVSVREEPVRHATTREILPISVCFINGRHRYAFLRDAGATKIPVAMDLHSIEVAGQHGLLA